MGNRWQAGIEAALSAPAGELLHPLCGESVFTCFPPRTATSALASARYTPSPAFGVVYPWICLWQNSPSHSGSGDCIWSQLQSALPEELAYTKAKKEEVGVLFSPSVLPLPVLGVVSLSQEVEALTGPVHSGPVYFGSGKPLSSSFVIQAASSITPNGPGKRACSVYSLATMMFNFCCRALLADVILGAGLGAAFQ